MQSHQDNIEFSLAKAVLQEASENEKIREVLYEAALVANEHIFKPIIDALKEAKGDINKIPPDIRAGAMLIIEEHSSDERQELGVYRYKSADELIKNNLVLDLFEKLQDNLLKIKDAKSIDDIQHSMKALANGCWGYVEKFNKFSSSDEKKQANFDRLKKIIMPSVEEGAARIKNTEMGRGFLSVPEASGKKKLVDKKEAPEMAFVTGRSTFWGMDLAKRLEFKIQELDRNLAKQAQLKEMVASLASKEDPESVANSKKAQADLAKLEKDCEELKKFVCDNFKVPLDKAKRKETSFYVEKTFIEKIAASSQLPVVASSSGTEGRPLIALYHLDFFGRGKDFDFDKAQILANCFFGVLTYGGHHTYIELVEPYNRLLDAAGIEFAESGQDSSLFTTKQVSVLAAGEVEDLLRFIHPDIRETVEQRMEENEREFSVNNTPSK